MRRFCSLIKSHVFILKLTMFHLRVDFGIPFNGICAALLIYARPGACLLAAEKSIACKESISDLVV